MSEHTFSVPEATSEGDVEAITSALLGVNGVYDVDIDPTTGEVTVRHDLVVNTGAMRQAIQDAGYTISGDNLV